MGFQTPLYELAEYIKWTREGKIQLPDFQRGYKWEDERIRQLLVTILRGHPLGVVMLLSTGNDNIRFKPKPLEGTESTQTDDPEWLLLDGQQRLTSLTQALTGDGVVATKDSRERLFERRYFIDMRLALEGEDRMEEAVFSLPADGIERANFGRDVVRDLSTKGTQIDQEVFPVNELFGEGTRWLLDLEDRELIGEFDDKIIRPMATYNIPAIELDKNTSKAAVATVFEKVNTGGLALNVFELLTATFAGDPSYYEDHGTDFRLNDDWLKTKELFADYPVLAKVENTDFLQAVTLLTTRKQSRAHTGSSKPPAVSARREDILKLRLEDYLEWVEPLREAYIWVADFLADRHIFDTKFLPYDSQMIPLACIRVIMGGEADLIGNRQRLVQWFWCGILGELYGGTTATRFVRDVEQVPAWAQQKPEAVLPSTIQDATFVESRLHSLRTRLAAAYKGIYALLLNNSARDWMEDKALDMVQYRNLAVDIHHIFPRAWCESHGIDAERRDSIINKTALSASTNRTIGGSAPSTYLKKIEDRAHISTAHLDELVDAHLVSPDAMRTDDFEAFFGSRREQLCQLVEKAMGKAVPRDLDEGHAEELSDQFDDHALIGDEEEGP